MEPRKLGDFDPTGEQEVVEFDGTQTLQLDDTYRFRVVSASESETGRVDHDDRGQSAVEMEDKPRGIIGSDG